MSKYKLIQLTNKAVGEIDVDSYMPLGLVTRRLNSPHDTCSTFHVASSTSDVVYITEPGYYEITYSASLTGAAAGDLTLTLVANQNDVYTVTESVAAAEDIVNLTLPYVIRVCPNSCATPYNCPVAVQIRLGGVATGVTPNPSTTNLIIKKVY